MNVNEQIIAQVIQSVLEGKRAGGTQPVVPGESKLMKSGVMRTEAIQSVSCMTANITLDAAEALMKKVEAKATSMGMKVVTAVADAHGNPVAVRCMDDAFIGSYDVALNKTYTSVAFKMSTEELGKLSQPGGPLYGIQHTNQGRIVIFGGGVPLKVGENIIGAFGVSGGSAEQDTYLANFALQVFDEMTGQ